MVLNMADFYKFCKSLQTLLNCSKTLPNWFLTPCTTVSVDFGWIRKARKLADFEQKAWAIAHGFEHGRFWQVLKSLQTLWNGSKTIPNWFLTTCTTVSVDFGWIRKAGKLADFEQKAWAIALGFEHGRFWQVLQIAPNTLKRFQNPPKLIFNSLHDCFRRYRWIRKARKLSDFEQKASAIAHGFEHGRFWQVLQIAPNTLKRFQNPPKLIFNYLHDCLRRFRVNWQGSKIGRFWAKSLGYSPRFWTWPILTSPRNRSKVTETVPKPS